MVPLGAVWLTVSCPRDVLRSKSLIVYSIEKRQCFIQRREDFENLFFFLDHDIVQVAGAGQ